MVYQTLDRMQKEKWALRADEHLERLAERLRRLRIRRGWKQRDLAAAAGVAASTVARYERGSDEPTLGTLIKLARALDTSVSYLIGENDTGPVVPQPENRDDKLFAAFEHLSGEIARLADAIEALSKALSSNATDRPDPADGGAAAGEAVKGKPRRGRAKRDP